MPDLLADVLAVAELYFRTHDWVRSCDQRARQRSVDPTTVRDACTRRLSLNTEGFRALLDNPPALRRLVLQKFPEYATEVNQVLGTD